MSTLHQIFESFNSLKVLIIGDLMIDAYLWGRVDRISPEAPVPVVSVKNREMRLGGAGNVVMNLKALGAQPIICSVIGTDSAGQTMLDLLATENISTKNILQVGTRPTTIKERIIVASQQLARIDSETDELIAEAEQNALFEIVKKQIENGVNVVLFQDYDKGVLSKILIEKVIKLAQLNNIPTVVDPKKRNFLNYKQATLFKPNLKELKDGLGISFSASNLAEIENVIGVLKEKLELAGVFLTLSEKGVYIDYQGQKHQIPAHARSIADVSGAGDTVISIAACCVAMGLAPDLVAKLANLGGGLVCEQIGVVPIDKQLLLEEALKDIK